jgi:pilus assembly protein CpaB
MTRRRRGLLMLGAAAVCAGLAGSAAERHAAEVNAQVGPLVPVVVAGEDLPRGALVTPALARNRLSRRRVPARFAPPRALRSPREALGYRTLTPLFAGDYVGSAQLGTPRAARDRSRAARGARLVEVSVVGTETIAAALRPGTSVDVLVTTEDAAAPRTYLALQRLELVDFRPPGPTSTGGERGPRATATLRTTLRQAATLTAAQNFAREVRVVPRAPGDSARLGNVSVSAEELGP